MTERNERPLRAVVGAGVRAVRERYGKTQDDVARAARGLGLRWDRARVAKLEAGDKPLSADELVELPLVLTYATDAEVGLGDLIDPAARVELRGGASISGADVLQVLGGGPLGKVRIGPPARKVQGPTWWEALFTSPVRIRAGQLGLGESDALTLDAMQDGEETAGDAESKAASVLGEPRTVVLWLAIHLWGRSLTAERDARSPADASAQKRGRVTRELLDEMRAYIAEKG